VHLWRDSSRLRRLSFNFLDRYDRSRNNWPLLCPMCVRTRGSACVIRQFLDSRIKQFWFNRIFKSYILKMRKISSQISEKNV